MINLSSITNTYLFLFFIFYFTTYPLRVFFLNENFSIIYVQLILTPFLIFFYINNINVLVKFKKNDLLYMGLIICIILLYIINIIHFDFPKLLLSTFYKYVNFSFLFLIFFIIKNNIKIHSLNNLQWLFFVLSVMTFIGVLCNSFLLRIPLGAVLSEKYFIGQFIRAGGGYLDPNFLSINIISLLFLSLVYINNYWLKNISVIMLFISYFLTFSRGAIVFGTIFTLAYLFYRNKKTIKVLIFSILFFMLVTYFIIDFFDMTYLFDRFTNEEGQSSTDDRFYQYNSFLSLIEEKFTLSNFILGFGGMDFFILNFGVALHSFWLNLILDIGILAPFIIIVLLFHFFFSSRNVFSKYLLAFWLLQASVLPNVPDTLFFIFILSLLPTPQREKDNI